jgi:uncharacterized protein (TIGR00159 family)
MRSGIDLIFLLKIGFLPVRIWDVFDIVIVGYLLYQLYKLLKGSIAFNIFIGIVTLYIVWWLVGALNMDLLALLLKQFVNVGFILVIIIFQPEVRRFLLMLGNTTLRQRSKFLSRLMDRNQPSRKKYRSYVEALKSALLRMSRNRVGALIVITDNPHLEVFGQSGVLLEANISQPLVESVFSKESPLHDGAMIISDGKIYAASCVLPVSDNPDLPKTAGLRHRAGVGVTETTNVGVFIVSEENGKISFAHKGQLAVGVSEEELEQLLKRFLV